MTLSGSSYFRDPRHRGTVSIAICDLTKSAKQFQAGVPPLISPQPMAAFGIAAAPDRCCLERTDDLSVNENFGQLFADFHSASQTQGPPCLTV